MDTSMMDLSMPIYLPSKVSSIEDWLTLLREDSRAKTSALQGTKSDWMETEAVFGGKCLDAFAKWDHDASLLRTFQESLFEDKPEQWLESFPPSGTIRSGIAYRLRPLVPRTSVGGGGVLQQWHTPTTGDTSPTWDHRASPGHVRKKPVPNLAAQVMWPTPKANKVGGYSSEGFSPTLEQAVRWPTPRSSEIAAEAGLMKNIGHIVNPKGNLEEVVWERTGEPNTGALNPTWVEWLMGLPLGWTGLEPLATESFQKWWQSFCGDYE